MSVVGTVMIPISLYPSRPASSITGNERAISARICGERELQVAQ
jgi:hypothetical protein